MGLAFAAFSGREGLVEIVLWVVAGIVGLNAGLVALAAVLTAVRQHRRRREIRTLERQWQLDRVSSPDASPALTPRGGLVRVSSGDRSPAITPHRRRSVPVTSKRGRPPPHYRGTHVQTRPSRTRTSGRRSLQVLVFAVVVCAGTALASPDAREVVTSALGAVARAFGLDPEPGPASPERESPLPTQLETSGAPRIGIGVVPGRERQSVRATDIDTEADTELPPSIGPDREIWPPTPTTPPTTEIQLPSAPVSVSAISVSSTQINLEWTDVAAETGYRIEHSPNGETEWEPLGSTGQDVTTYSDVELSPSTTYFYRVFAFNDRGDSSSSGVASATTVTDPPSAPDTLIATAASSTQIDLEWSDVATEEGYRIERSLDGETEWGPIGAMGPDETTFSDVEGSPGTTYYYRVFAVNGGGESPSSGVASATTVTDPPSPPDDVTATAVSSTQIDLEWADVENETGYRIERSSDGETEWTAIGTTDRDITVFSNGELTPGTNYVYRVFATNAGGDSHASSVSLLTTTLPSQS
jgi:fibronectin type 3 domain-containing protein